MSSAMYEQANSSVNDDLDFDSYEYFPVENKENLMGLTTKKSSKRNNPSNARRLSKWSLRKDFSKASLPATSYKSANSVEKIGAKVASH